MDHLPLWKQTQNNFILACGQEAPKKSPLCTMAIRLAFTVTQEIPLHAVTTPVSVYTHI